MAIFVLSGCVKSLTGLVKSDTRNVASNPPSTLIKPKIEDTPVNQTLTEKAEENPVKDPTEPKLDTSTESKNATLLSETVKKSLEPEKPASTDQMGKTPKRLTGIEQGDFPEEKDQKRGDKPALPIKNRPDSEEEDVFSSDVEETTPSFKKHDHTKYVSKIRNSAIDVVNRENDSIYARVCKNGTTEEWSLGIYFVQGKNYYFRVYVWDPIENVWTETFESEKRAYAGLKKHLSFSSAGKRCIALKGSDKE